MVLRHDDDYTPVEDIVRTSRHLSRQDILNEKRMRNTDLMPAIEADAPQSSTNSRQFNQSRDENRRLRKEIELLQRRLAQQRETDTRLEQQIETIHRGHQLEIEQYQNSLRQVMEELNEKRDMLQESEQRYQELYHSFHVAVEEETRKLLAETAKTIKLSPGHTPPILQELMQALESQVRQTGDQRLAEVMTLMRQVQRKNEQIEQELAGERESIARERQQLLVLQKNIREQSIERQKFIDASLRTRYTGLLAILLPAVLVVAVFVQVILINVFQIPQNWALISPILLCVLAAYILSRLNVRPGKSKGKPAQTQEKKKPA